MKFDYMLKYLGLEYILKTKRKKPNLKPLILEPKESKRDHKNLGNICCSTPLYAPLSSFYYTVPSKFQP